MEPLKTNGGPNLMKKNISLEVIAPRCKTGDDAYFLTEEADIEEHGFTLQEAKLGICVRCAISPSSIEGEMNDLTKDDLINKKEGNFIEDENGKTKARHSYSYHRGSGRR